MQHSRVHFALALGLLSQAVSAAGPGPFVEVIDDFNDGNADGWTELNLLEEVFGPSTYEVVDGRYQITTVELPALPMILAEAALWDASVDPRYSNGMMRVTVRFNNDRTNATLVLRAEDPTASYAFFINNFENVIGIADASVGGNLTFAELEIVEDVDYVIQATFMGGNLAISVWRADGKGELATVCLTDSRYSLGVLGVAVYNHPDTGGVLSAQFDDICFVPGPDMCEVTCAADTDGNREVDFRDLLTVLAGWGPCP